MTFKQDRYFMFLCIKELPVHKGYVGFKTWMDEIKIYNKKELLIPKPQRQFSMKAMDHYQMLKYPWHNLFNKFFLIIFEI